MGRGKAKGGGYEREVCRQLSLWWSAGKREDYFWRAAGSGNRAKSRGRKGKATAGQHGDICATDPMGAPLIDVLTIEVKRGYNKVSLSDFIDLPKSQIHDWLEQVIESYEQSGSFSWMLIVRRDKRNPIVIIPDTFVRVMIQMGCLAGEPLPVLSVNTIINGQGMRLLAMPLELWLSCVTPLHIKRMARDL